jgi:hypothetical protein
MDFSCAIVMEILGVRKETFHPALSTPAKNDPLCPRSDKWGG